MCLSKHLLTVVDGRLQVEVWRRVAGFRLVGGTNRILSELSSKV